MISYILTCRGIIFVLLIKKVKLSRLKQKTDLAFGEKALHKIVT